MIEEREYTHEQQAAALAAAEKIVDEPFFKALVTEQEGIWEVPAKVVGFTKEELQVYVFHHALIEAVEKLKRKDTDEDDEFAFQISVLAWMYWWTDLSPKFGSAVKKMSDYVISGSKKE